MPTAGTGEAVPSAWGLAAKRIRDEFRRKVNGPVKVELSGDDRATLWVNDIDIPEVIGKGGRNIEMMEKRLGIHIDVKPLDSTRVSNEEEVMKTVVPEISLKKKHIILKSLGVVGADVEVMVDGEFIFTATVGRKGDIRIVKDSDIGNRLQEALRDNLKISIRTIT